MTVQAGCGPTWAIDGPPPQAPLHTLLGASRIVEDVTQGDVERWINGVKVYPAPLGPAHVWDAQASGSSRLQKTFAGATGLPQFQAMAVYLGDTCTAAGISGGGLSQDESQARYVARATQAFGAVEAAAVEHEFMTGEILGGVNPHLSDGNATVIGGAGGRNIRIAFAELENAIAVTGRAGVIHCTPAAALVASSYNMLAPPAPGPRSATGDTSVIRTVNGTIVVPGYGYVGASAPAGQAGAGTHQEWVYATGPVEVRRSQTFLVPEDVAQAVDRRTNSIAYLVERYYVADWDTTLQAAVLADWGI